MIKSIDDREERQLEIDLTGPDGNAYYLLGLARRLADQLGLDGDTICAEMKSDDYDHLVQVFDCHFGEYVIFCGAEIIRMTKKELQQLARLYAAGILFGTDASQESVYLNERDLNILVAEVHKIAESLLPKEFQGFQAFPSLDACVRLLHKAKR